MLEILLVHILKRYNVFFFYTSARNIEGVVDSVTYSDIANIVAEISGIRYGVLSKTTKIFSDILQFD